MKNDKEQSSWREFVGLYSDLFGVVGGVVAVLTFLLWAIGFLPFLLVVIVGTAAVTLFCVGLMGHTFVSNNRPLDSIGEWLNKEPKMLSEQLLYQTPVQNVTPKVAAPLIETRRVIEEIEQHYELKKLEPNLHHLEGMIVDAHEGEHGVIIEGALEGARNFQAVILPYHNSPDTRSKRRIGVVNGVSAEIRYRFFDGSHSLTVHHGAWLSEKDNKVNFGVTAKRSLIIAVIDETNELYAVEREFDGVHPEGITKRVKKLVGDLFGVHARLITESDGATIDKYEMVLIVSKEPAFRVELDWAVLWRMRHLTDFLLQGYDFMKRLYEIGNESHKQGMAIKDFFNAEVLAAKKKKEEEIGEQVKGWEISTRTYLALPIGQAKGLEIQQIRRKTNTKHQTR